MATAEEHAGEMPGNKIHPDLRGGQAPFPHKFDKCRMEALTAICDTLIPSLPDEARDFKLEDQQNFFLNSASDADAPAEVAGLMFKFLDTEVQGVVSLILWLLSTRFGTLVLCGRNAFSSKFPYLHPFSELPAPNRESALRSWSTGSIARFQSLFKLFKAYCVFAFFTKVDESGNNDFAWDAMGYQAPGPAGNGLPTKSDRNRDDKLPELQQVFDMTSSPEGSLEKFLLESGFPCEPNQTPSERQDLIVECDVVVVGSGAGGGVCAAALAAEGHKVIVLEKGKRYTADQLSLLEGPSYQAMYEGGGLLATRDASLTVLAGSTLGGGTAVNWSASFRTPREVIGDWSSVHGLGLFAGEDYSAAMDKVCERLGVGTHGDEEEFESFQNAVLRKGCRKLGLSVETIPRNCGGKRHWCGSCGFGCKSRQKQATLETWLMDAVGAGAVILCGCTAEKIVLDHQENGLKSSVARGVLATSRNGERVFIKAKSTVVSCGSIHTPVLLKKSGLRNSQIGSNLHLHPTVMAWGYFPPREDLPGGTITDGPIMTAISKRRGAILEVPTLHPASFAVMSPWQTGSSFKHRMMKHSRTSHVIVIAKDASGGSVKVNRSGTGSPVMSYKLVKEDEETMKNGLEQALRVLIAAGAEEVGTHHPDGEKLEVKKNSEEGIEEFLGRLRKKSFSIGMSMASAHQMGSCRMGVNPAVSAVDPKGETWECSGLFVADASLFPTALGVNPMITVQSLAYCVAGSVHSYLR